MFAALLSALLGACTPGGEKTAAGTTAGASQAAEAQAQTGGNGSGGTTSAAETGGVQAQAAEESGTITRVHFTYNKMYTVEVEMDVWAEPITETGAELQMSKRVGPNNYTGKKKKGTISISRAQVDELLEILGRYDLEGYAKLPAHGSVAGTTRSIAVFYGERMVNVSWNTRFPETLPPEEDIMYSEIFNYFEGIIDREPGWEEVRSDLLEDPRDNPAYYERTVSWFGHEVSLVPGTGVYHEDGRGARIDYGDKKWWQEEGFSGTWTMTEKDQAERYATDTEAEFTVSEDGSVTLKTSGRDWSGTLPDVRRYREDIQVELKCKDVSGRTFTISLINGDEDYGRLRISAYPDPYPTEQFKETDIYVTQD